MNVVTVLLGAMALLVVGAVVTALLAKQRRRCGWVAFAFVFPACLGAFYVALQVFAQGEALGRPIVSLRDFGLNASLQLRVDELSAVFLMITSLIATCATLYSVRYVLFYEGENLVRYYPLLLLFIASIMGVVGVADMFFFIVFWELMTLTSYVLVVYERQEPANLRAGIRYFLATHIATGCMILATIVLYVNTPLRSFEFASLRQGVENLLATNPALAHLALLLFFVGFATKAGVLPFGFWLPDAYPAAPSGASAAFAGTMTKLGVYGIVRVFVEILPLSHASTVWGEIIAIFGTLSIFIGTVTALVQSDSKRLLSFHIIGQVGYMLLGVGTGICFLRLNPALATVALMSGLFHVVNHACYKSLLFLNAGAALYRTGTRDLNKMGGLMAIMPLTATTAIIASLSIAGIPPFSGFSSKWLIFQSTLTGGLVIPLFLALGCVAIFISAVTLASFLKFLGTAFFGSLYPEREEAGPAEVPLSMKVPQVVIAIFCVLFGVWPLLPVRLLYGAANAVLPAEYAPNFAWLFGASPVGINFNVGEGVTGVWNPLFLVGGLLVCCALAYALYRLAGAPVRRTSPWFCGEEHAGDEVRYKAHGFYLPFQDFLSFRIGTRRVRTYYPTLPRPKVGDLPRLRALLDFDRLYYRLIAIGAKWCERFSESHVGYPQMYVLWMAVGIVIAIAILYALS